MLLSRAGIVLFFDKNIYDAIFCRRVYIIASGATFSEHYYVYRII